MHMDAEEWGVYPFVLSKGGNEGGDAFSS